MNKGHPASRVFPELTDHRDREVSKEKQEGRVNRVKLGLEEHRGNLDPQAPQEDREREGVQGLMEPGVRPLIYLILL